MTVLISELSEAILSRISKFVNRFCTDFKTSIGVKNMYEIYCKLRDAKGCKDSDVAKNTGITKSTFSDWKSGRSNPKNDKLQKIADYFDVSINYLTGNSFIEDMGRIIQEERIRQKMTQEEIATAANISVAELDDYESLGLPIREDIFNDIADALGTSYLQLLYDYDLYDDYVPPHYNGDVVKWEADKRAGDLEAMRELAKLDPAEQALVDGYRVLDKPGKDIIDIILGKELERVKHMQSQLADQQDQINMLKQRIVTELAHKIAVPLYGKFASAGSGAYLFDDIPTDMIEVEDTPTARKADFVIGVNGDSMEPDFYDGEKVFVKKTSDLNVGDIGIFLKGEDCYLKELGADRLISHNKTYEDIRADEEIRIVGKVIGKVKGV